IRHPGIYLGADSHRNQYFLHNHYHYGKATVCTIGEFAQSQPIHEYSEKCTNAPLAVIESGLNQVVRGERYNFANYNCQTFVNVACNNERRSQDVEKWVGRVVFGVFTAALIGLIAKS